LDQANIIHIDVPDSLSGAGTATVVDEIQLIEGIGWLDGTDRGSERDIPGHRLRPRHERRSVGGDRRKISGRVVASD